MGDSPKLSDAFDLGLLSLFKPKGSTSVTQSQNVNQATQVEVSNIIGSNPFANADSQGNFDAYLALQQVFQIRDALAAGEAASSATGGKPMASFAKAPFNWTPIILIGGGMAILMIITKGKIK